MQNYYQEDLAYVHSMGYSNYATEAGDFLLSKLSERGVASGSVVDLGCGGGQLLAKVAQGNFETIGVEYSADIIELAQQNAPNTTFHHASIWDYELPSCVAVTAIGEILTYTFDEKNSTENMERLFQHIYNQLITNGVFVFDVLTPENITKPFDYKIVKHDEWTMNMEYHYDTEAWTLVRDITLFRKLKNGWYRKSHEAHKVRLLEVDSLIAMLKKIGFHCQLLESYGKSQFRKGHVGILAMK